MHTGYVQMDDLIFQPRIEEGSQRQLSIDRASDTKKERMSENIFSAASVIMHTFYFIAANSW